MRKSNAAERKDQLPGLLVADTAVKQASDNFRADADLYAYGNAASRQQT